MTRYATNPPRQPTVFDYAYYGTAGFVRLVPSAPAFRDWFVLGPSSQEYNCVAWTLGVQDVELGTSQDPFPLAGVDEFYAAFGYSKVIPGHGTGGVQPYDVLAYGPSDDAVSHVAVFLDVAGLGPTWTSKLGAAQLISHAGDQLVPGPYGDHYPAYYTHHGTIPVFEGDGSEEAFVRDWSATYGRGPTFD
ncbi:MAG: hypothetical protein AAGE94_23675 [Acidobacteriota bacterium]